MVCKKSKFIGNIAPSPNKKQAEAFITQTKNIYKDAAHNVYAYIVDDGKYVKASDDGEPAKTAGLPILKILQSAQLVNVVLVITRYFGGTLLGTGGLIRAYSGSAKETIRQAKIKKKHQGVRLKIRCSYDKKDALLLILNSVDAIFEKTNYEQDVAFYCWLSLDSYSEFSTYIRAFDELIVNVEILEEGFGV